MARSTDEHVRHVAKDDIVPRFCSRDRLVPVVFSFQGTVPAVVAGIRHFFLKI